MGYSNKQKREADYWIKEYKSQGLSDEDAIRCGIEMHEAAKIAAKALADDVEASIMAEYQTPEHTSNA